MRLHVQVQLSGQGHDETVLQSLVLAPHEVEPVRGRRVPSPLSLRDVGLPISQGL